MEIKVHKVFNDGHEYLLASKIENLNGTSSTQIDAPDLSASIERKNRTWTVTIDGKEVFSNILAKKVVITNHWSEPAEREFSSDRF